jgi:hypothetical protein
MEMVLLDWTRMGNAYCLAGVVQDDGRYRVVRPLNAKCRDAPVRNVGWQKYLLDGHRRWEVFRLIGQQPAEPQAPHLEDVWVSALKPLGCQAPLEQRREILERTQPAQGEPLFGTRLQQTAGACCMQAGAGCRSLTTFFVEADRVSIHGFKVGAAPTIRVQIRAPNMMGKQLPLKDHHLLCRAEEAATDIDGQVRTLQGWVAQMGQWLAIRFGLSRPFAPGTGNPVCWLMVDGIFALENPEP